MRFNTADKVYVKRIGGEWILSEILCHRMVNDDEGEYFVHYEGYNRRLDEWVHEKNIISTEDYDNDHLDVNNDPLHQDPFKKLTRHQKRKFNEINHISKSIAEMDPITASLERAYEEKTKIKYISTVVLGDFQIDTWYYSPYPNEYQKLSVIFICETCLKYMALKNTYIKHRPECTQKTPPGREIYHHKNLHIFEIDGASDKLYCQNLCLMAKLFLYHKTLYFDVSFFLFYVLYEFEDNNYHIASYFSKEKKSLDNYNVACILTFPPYQRKGYGKFLIALSYELSKREKKVGTPERPLSDLGHALYRSYWAYIVLDILRKNKNSAITVNEISEQTAMSKSDIVETLQLLNLLKYWKGNYISSYSSKKIHKYLKAGHCKPPSLLFKPELLKL